MQKLALWIAQGLGIGRVPVAPGTFGSVLGLLWFVVLLQTGKLEFLMVGLAAGALVSVWLCGLAEKILRRKDPGSVVLDEITAMPVCFLPWLLKLWMPHHVLPGAHAFFGNRTWYFSAVLFILFRILDIAKPWPIRPSQNLSGGWGVTVDDFLAAAGVALLSLLMFFFM
jgi:phosphatidylglycerophosphatase A